MGFQLPITIAEAIKKIQTNDLVLPAIQREFVWEEDQIVRLFDSLLRGYPIGSFLSWEVKPETANKFKFYGFLREYHEKENPHCPVLDIPKGRTVMAVLDGQQRLTALNIGLRGSFAARVRGGWWNNPKAFPEKRLYVNALAEAPENELGMMWDFRFLAGQPESPQDGSAYWFPVNRIFEIEDIADLMTELAAHQLGNDKFASRLVGDLYKAIHTTGALYFYEELDQDVEKVLDIFIRVNSGGTTLSYSDLLLSIATAQWDERDAREAIHALVDELNSMGQGFRFTKDVVLKSGLVLIGVPDISFKVRNFNHENMTKLEKEWDEVSDALRVAVALLADFGLSEPTLTAGSVLIPLAYYIRHRGLSHTYRSSPATAHDRRLVRDWVMRTLVKPGIWGSGLDTLLRDVRDVIAEYGLGGFPVTQLESRMAARGKSLVFAEEEFNDLLESKYGGKRTFATLALMFPHVDTRNIHHVDHVFPRGLLTSPKLKAAGLAPDAITLVQQHRDQLPNLELLEGPENIAKRDQSPLTWAKATYRQDSYEAYLARNSLPGLPADAISFEQWFEDRRGQLRVRLEAVLGLAAKSGS